MKDLIEALTVFSKYTQDNRPTICEHDELIVLVDPSLVNEEDMARLSVLGFLPSDEHFKSFRFGSA